MVSRITAPQLKQLKSKVKSKRPKTEKTSPKTIIRVLVVDDHPLTRDGLIVNLEYTGDFDIVGQAGDSQEAIYLAEKLRPNVAIIDLQLPNIEGFEATKETGIDTIHEIKRRTPMTEVVVISFLAEEEYISKSLQAGAINYIPKDTPQDKIRDIIRAAARGEAELLPVIKEGLDKFSKAQKEKDLSSKIKPIVRQKRYNTGVNNQPAQSFVINPVMPHPESEPRAVNELSQERINQAFDAVVERLRADPTKDQPTKYEQILELVRARDEEGITLDDIVPLYEDAANPEAQAATAIRKLNVKLKSFGLRLEHPSTFNVVPLDNDTD